MEEKEKGIPSAMTRPHRRLWLVGRFLLPIAFFFVVTVIMTYPLITNLTGGLIRHPIISRSVDIDTERWAFWWFKTAIVDRQRNPFYTDMLYYPYRQADNPLPLYYNDNHPLDMIIAMPIIMSNNSVVGPTLAYNLLTLAHLTFAGCAMFWLVRYLLSNRGDVRRTRPGEESKRQPTSITGGATLVGGLVAGILYAFSPLHQYQLDAGHLVLLATGWMLLHILFLHKLLYNHHVQPNNPGIDSGEPAAGEARKQRRRMIVNGVLAALSLLATSFTNWYLTAFLLVLATLMALVRFAQQPREWRATAIKMAAVLALWLVGVSPFLIATIRGISAASSELVSGLDYEVTLSLSPLDLITISKDTRVEPALWWPGTLGYTAMILGAVGVVAARRMRRSVLFWIVLITAGVTLSLGPYLKWDPEVREVSGTTGIPLPYLLFRNLPFMSIARAPRRFVLLADMGLSVLAGFGASYLVYQASQLKSRLANVSMARALPWAVAAILIVVPILELQTLPQPVAKVVASPFLVELGADKDDYAILELPVTTHYSRDHDRMFNQTLHRKKIIGGYLSRRVYDYYWDASSPFQSIARMSLQGDPDIVPTLSPLEVCNYYNIPYIVEYKQSISYERPEDRQQVRDFVRQVFGDPSAAMIYEDEHLTAYRVPPTAPQPSPTVMVHEDQQLIVYREPAAPAQARPLIWLGDGWFPAESEKSDDGGETARVWRWSKGSSELYISTQRPISVRMRFVSSTLRGEGDLDVVVNGSVVRQFRLTPQITPFEVDLELPVGQTQITFRNNAQTVTPIEASVCTHDARELSFVVTNLNIETR
jgi:hypothetical protein